MYTYNGCVILNTKIEYPVPLKPTYCKKKLLFFLTEGDHCRKPIRKKFREQMIVGWGTQSSQHSSCIERSGNIKGERNIVSCWETGSSRNNRKATPQYFNPYLSKQGLNKSDSNRHANTGRGKSYRAQPAFKEL